MSSYSLLDHGGAVNFLLTADMLADLEAPHEIQLSPSAKHVVYTLRSDFNRPRGRWVSSLWIAEVGKQDSARQLTNGDSNDSWPQFSPDGNSIAFLSDRESEGVNAIWIMDVSGGDAAPLTSTNCEKGVSNFAWSGDGRLIAFLSADERTAERKRKDERGDDAMVYGEHWENAQLRTVEVATKTVTTRTLGNGHVYDFSWSPDSQSLVYAMQRTPEGSSAWVHGTSLEVVELGDNFVSSLSTFPSSLEDLCWVAQDLWWRATRDLTTMLSAKSLYRMPLSTRSWLRHTFGDKECASTWAMPPGLRKVSEDSIVVQVQSGLADQLWIFPKGAPLYGLLHEIKSWDGAYKDGNVVLAVVKSSADVPNEVYSILDGETVRLSNHGKEVAELEIATSTPFYATAQDGTNLDGILVIPKAMKLPKPWPTIVLVHGGPYQRVSQGFDLPFFNWSPWFASQGYAVLCVNYRGGSSHGDAHAGALREAAGTTDYSDTIDLVKAGIAEGIIDPDRVGIAGWSYGGYISFLAATRDSTFHFQAVICGAGISDWDLSIMTSGDALFGVQIAGAAPWESDMSSTQNRKGSAIWHMQDIRTPVLLLHGENDDVVPVSQSRAFHQGCLSRGVPCELVVYPREGHGMFPPFERAHYIDLMERVKRFFNDTLVLGGSRMKGIV